MEITIRIEAGEFERFGERSMEGNVGKKLMFFGGEYEITEVEIIEGGKAARLTFKEINAGT